MANLPTLDFSQFTSGSKFEQQRFGKALVDSFKNHGFVKLVKHGFPEETIEELLDFVRTIATLLLCEGKKRLQDSYRIRSNMQMEYAVAKILQLA